jgi:hypothetical protein
MKQLLIALLLASNVLAQDITPAPLPALVETPSMDVDIRPQPPFINEINCPDDWFFYAGACRPFVFNSHIEAEQHYYHCAWGVKIWGDMIKGFEPEFIPVDVSSIIEPKSFCYGFELYPDSNICNNFQNQFTTELNYAACLQTNQQYWFKLQFLLELNKPKPPTQCKRFGGTNIWKAKSETRNSSVIVLDSSYCVDDRSLDDMKPIDIWLEDINGNRIDNGSYRHCNRHNGNRLHYDFSKGTGEAVVVMGYEDETTECFYVPERSRDQR